MARYQGYPESRGHRKRLRSKDPDQEYCGAKTVNGGACENYAGWGTDHPGFGHCRHHGGNRTVSILSAARQQAVVMGVAVDVDPHEALLYCVKATAGEVVYCNHRIAELSHEDAAGQPEEVVERQVLDGDGFVHNLTTTKKHVPQLNVWVQARANSMERLARFSKMALDAGVEERRVRLAESHAEGLAPVLRDIFDELDLTPEQLKLAPIILEKHLTKLEGNQFDPENTQEAPPLIEA